MKNLQSIWLQEAEHCRNKALEAWIFLSKSLLLIAPRPRPSRKQTARKLKFWDKDELRTSTHLRRQPLKTWVLNGIMLSANPQPPAVPILAKIHHLLWLAVIADHSSSIFHNQTARRTVYLKGTSICKHSSIQIDYLQIYTKTRHVLYIHQRKLSQPRRHYHSTGEQNVSLVFHYAPFHIHW